MKANRIHVPFTTYTPGGLMSCRRPEQKTGENVCGGTGAKHFHRRRDTHKLQHVPVEDVVVGEALPVEEVPEELPQVGVVGFVVEPQRAAQVQVGGELGWESQKRLKHRSEDFLFPGIPSRFLLTGFRQTGKRSAAVSSSAF
uniref:Uncharacterized protein n=1 Tax=Oryzias sinensis TaxID=183150 RepID=A0A8C7ZJ68_9TELE